MPLNLGFLPFDVLFFVSQYLDIEDIVHLSLTCQNLRLLLQESTLCRRAVEDHVNHSYEASLARSTDPDQAISWKSALLRVYHRRKAFANASPVAASVIGYASDFCQKEGTVTYLTGNRIIHVLELLQTKPRYYIDLDAVLRHLTAADPVCSHLRFTQLNYSGGVLVLHCQLPSSPERSWLVALRTARSIPDEERLVLFHELEVDARLFVRNTQHYLYYGTHSGIGTHGHHEWRIRGLSLDPSNHPLPTDVVAIQLDDFAGSDIGSTVVFEIHGDYFYALSNQTSFDLEEVDWTSFYHCMRFPLANPSKSALAVQNAIYRRPHKEGPINDLWTDLSLQVDERTNDLVIVEARREWLRGGSTQYRTFYSQKLVFSSSDDPLPSSSSAGLFMSHAAESALPPTIHPLLPINDPLTQVLDSSNHPRYAPPQVRQPEEAHPEHGSELVGQPRSFTFARTKFRGYDYSSSAFLDIVEDAECCPFKATVPCLRLRIGSRRPAPLDSLVNRELPANVFTLHPPVPTPETQFLTYHYRYSPIQLWPGPPNPSIPNNSTTPGCPHVDPHSVLNPPRDISPSLQDGGLASACGIRETLAPSLPRSASTSFSSASSASYSASSLTPRYRHIAASLSSFCLLYHVRYAKDGVSLPEGEGALVCVAFDRSVNLNGAQNVWRRNSHRADKAQA